MPQEMDATGVETVTKFCLQQSAVGGAVAGRVAVAHAIAAGNEHLSARPSPQNLGQGAHEYMKAPIGLEIPCDVRDHLIATGQQDVLTREF
jgi:hypothetical protein